MMGAIVVGRRRAAPARIGRQLIAALVLGAVAGLAVAATATATPPPFAFGPATNISEGGLLGHDALADFTGSSALDLLVTSGSTDQLLLSAGDGSGGFGTPQPIQLPMESGPEWLATGDLARDGLTDAVTLGQNGSLYVLMQQPAPARGLSVGQTFNVGDGGTVSGVAIGDVNGDGIPDIVVGTSGGFFDVFYGHGDGTFTTTPQAVSFGAGATGQVLDVALGDLNGDHRLDVIGITQADDNSVQVDLALQSSSDDVTPVAAGTTVASPVPASFQTPSTISVGGLAQFPTDLLLADLNGDGADDIVTSSDGYGGGSHGALVVLLNEGNGTGMFGAPASYPTDLGPNEPVAADLNGDGLMDLAVPSNDGTIDLLPNQGNGTFGAATSLPTDPDIAYGGLAAADLNGDGRPDLVASGGGDVQIGGGVVSELLNAATPTAQTGSAVDVGGTTASLLGTINGAGAGVSFRFQYGPGASGTTYPSQTPLVDAFAATGDTVEAADLTGLSPSTPYHYRIVAETSAGTLLAAGADRSFTTTASTSTTVTGPSGPTGPEGPEGPSGANAKGVGKKPVVVGYLTLTSSSITGDSKLKKTAGSIPLTAIDLLTSHLSSVSGAGAGKAQFKLTTEEGLTASKGLLASFLDNRAIHKATMTVLRPGKGKGKGGSDLTIKLADLAPTSLAVSADETSTTVETSFDIGGTIIVSGGSVSTSKGIGWSVITNKSDTQLSGTGSVSADRRMSAKAATAVVHQAVHARVAGTRASGRPARDSAGSRKLELALLNSSSAAIAPDKLVPLTAASFVISHSVKLGAGSGAGAGKVTFNPLTLEFPEITNVSQEIAQDQRSGSQPTLELLLPGAGGSKGTDVQFLLWATSSDELSAPNETVNVKFGAAHWTVGTSVTGTASPVSWSVIKNKTL
jgi:hypothetical protein